MNDLPDSQSSLLARLRVRSAGRIAAAVLVVVAGGACAGSTGIDESSDADGEGADTGFALRILAGLPSNAPPYHDSEGNTWTPDAHYDVGNTVANSDAITGTADAALFHGERWASRTANPNGFTYTFPNVPSGDYFVKLGFAETSTGPVRAAGQRRFDVYLNGAKVLAELDIYQRAGLDTALVESFEVKPVNGTITIRFAPGSIQNPKVDFISITPASLHAIAPQFFGLHLNKQGLDVQYGVRRLWDAGVAWAILQSDVGQYDFSPLQHQVSVTPAGVELMYTFGRTPTKLAQHSSVKCNYGNSGQCNPPLYVDQDDRYVKAFWNEFMSTMCTGTAPHKTCGPIKYFEMWNEPNGDGFWSGTYDQLARMSSDATAIIKANCASCVVLTANTSCGGDGYHANGQSGQCDVWMNDYLAAWQARGHLPDGGAWHAYPSHTNVSPSPFPETNVSSWDSCTGSDSASCTCKAGFVPNTACRHSILDQIGLMRGVFDAHGLAGKPMYATEGGWNLNTDLSNSDLQAAYVARWYLVQAGAGVAQAYWYAQDNVTWGTLVDASGDLNAAGHAYNAVHNWLVGASIGACSEHGSVWSCPLVEQSGAIGEILWDASKSCSGGSCTTSKFPVGAQFTKVHDLGSGVAPISGHAISIGAKPVLVD